MISSSHRREFLQNVRQRLHILLAELRRLHVLLDPRRRRRARDWNNGRHTLGAALRKHPANRDLRGCHAFLLCDVFDSTEKLDIFVEYVRLETWEVM